MTADEVVRRIRAWERGKPLLNGETLRVPRIDPSQILVVAFLRMGGESAPWGVAYGSPGKTPEVLTVPEARTRDDVAEMMARFAPVLLSHIHHPQHSPFGLDPDAKIPPFQIWVPNASHLEMLHNIAYSYTFTKFGDDLARRKRLNSLGHACGWLFRESQRPGQMIAIAASAVLAEAYTFPAETTRQGHLGFLLSWLKTGGGRDVRMHAAEQAERQSVSTNLDPAVERDEIAPYVDAYHDSRDENNATKRDKARTRIHKLLGDELLRRFRLVEEALDVLRDDKRRENTGLARLVNASLNEHRFQYRRIEGKIDDAHDGPAFVPSPETDRHPAAAGARYYVHEASQELLEVLLVHDDRELQAQLVAQGQAVAGTIIDVRDEGTGRKTIPVWTVESDGQLPLRLREGSDLCVVGLAARELTIRSVEKTPEGRYRFEMQVTSMLTVPRDNDGTVLPASSPRHKRRRVVLVRPSMDRIARRKSALIWNREVPGAWLTHAVPTVAATKLPEEVAENLTDIQGGVFMMAVGNHRDDIEAQIEVTTERLLKYVRAEGRLAVVQAPPGSGKTHLLLKAVIEAYQRNQRVAIATQTRSQADDICRRLADHFSTDSIRFVGHGQSAHLPARAQIIAEQKKLPSDRCIVVATTAKWGLIKVTDTFDVLFVEEAWQMAWADFMLLGQVAGRFVLIGDPGQIPPVVAIDASRWATAPRAPHRPAPELILQGFPGDGLKLDLPATMRLPEDSARLVRPFYDFPFEAWALPGERKLVPRRNPTGTFRAITDRLQAGSVVGVTLPTPDGGPPLERDDQVAKTAVDIVREILQCQPTWVLGDQERELQPSDIGLCATHHVMNVAMALNFDRRLAGVDIDTPERWQGLERKVMVIVHPLSGVVQPSDFDLETGRLCVMASRHQVALVVVTRDHLAQTLDEHLPSASQPVGRPDSAGRGHHQNTSLWNTLVSEDRVIEMRS